VHRYPYLDMPTRGVDFAGMVGCLNTLPPRSIVLLHPCCHNPTGADLTKEQWGEITNIAGSRRLIPFLDMAYQGFGENIDEDCYAIRAMADAGLSFFISSSFSKKFSLYGERCGGLSIICPSVDEAARALGQMEITVRRNYSSPPAHGGQLVTTILLDQELRKLWLSEVNAMRRRIKAMRNELHAALQRKRPAADFDYIVQQRGMFAYTGLSPAQVRELRTRFGIYLVESGRLCVAGLNAENVHRVATAMAEVIRQ
jgi:aromatic-amino-acid transaminase